MKSMGAVSEETNKSMAMDIAVADDIIQTHILTRLDGQTLTAAGCVSSHLQSLCSHQKLWSDICSSNWPSTDDVVVSQAIADFHSGYHSFFSDSFPSPSHRLNTTTSLPPTSRIISSVDLRYHHQLVFSKAGSTNTTPTDWFRSSPFRIDLLEPKKLVPSTVKISGDDQVVESNLQQHMTLSWILIDPAQNRAVNLSSINPVSVQRNWLTGNIDVTFAVLVEKDDVNCNVQMTCGVKEVGGVLHVGGVSLAVLDMDGRCSSGEESMVILQGLTVAQRRSRKCSGGGEGHRDRYEEYMRRRRERMDTTERREWWFDMACVASGVAFFMAFLSFALY